MVRGFIFSAALLLSGVFASAAVAAPGYRLQQTSDFYGDSSAEVSNQSLRLSSSRLGLRLHVAAPTFAMTAINDKNKQFANIPLKQWGQFVSFNRDGKCAKNDAAYIKVGSGKICGVPADEYLVQTDLRGRVRTKTHPELWVNGKSYNTRYWVSKQISPPREAYEIFSEALGMPSSLGMPVRMIQYNGDGQGFKTFDTAKIEKCEVADKLPVPTGYKRAADEMSLLVSGADSGGISALLGDDDLEDMMPTSNKPVTKVAKKERKRGWVPGMDVDADEAAVKPAPIKRDAGTWIPGT